MKASPLTNFVDERWYAVLTAVERVLNGPSAIVAKTTRLGFTVSAAKYAANNNKNILIVKPTNKISETVKAANKNALTVYGHSHCALLQKEDEVLLKLPLSLPKSCPKGPGGCEEYPECDLTRAWFESSNLRDITYAKLAAIAFSNPYDAESQYILDQLRDVDIVIFDESHTLCTENSPSVDILKRPTAVDPEVTNLFEVL